MIYDGILLGTGHNALVLACYAARAGLKVAVVEKNDVAGGGLTTVEHPPDSGFKHNTHSFFHRALSSMPWYRDLELERHGARYIEPELNVAMILPENRVLEWWTDFEKTFASFAAISPRDADRLREWTERFRPIVGQVLIPEAQNAPLPPEQRLAKLRQSELGRTLLEVQALSPIEFVMREFEHPAVRAGLLFFNGLREVDLRQQGFGHSIPALMASPRKAQMCLGGSRRLAEALCADLREHGGEIFTNWQPRSILTRNGRACGVESMTGDRIECSQFVASGLNPQQTFLDLIPADVTSAHLRERAAGFEYNLLAPLFALNLNLSEPPRYTAAEQHPELNQAFMMILGLDDVAQFHDIVAAHERGEIPRTVMWGTCPTQFDPTQAPVERHTAFMWEKLPYALHGDARNWDAYKEQHGREMLGFWQTYAPNLSEAVLSSFTRSALDTERLLPNMMRGDLLVGSFANDQIGYHRPFPGAGTYRSEIPGLYLCGGSTHPGGNVTGLCGFNAAKVVLADLGLSRA
jgi:phytoene dehydrogenase-like protein